MPQRELRMKTQDPDSGKDRVSKYKGNVDATGAPDPTEGEPFEGADGVWRDRYGNPCEPPKGKGK